MKSWEKEEIATLPEKYVPLGAWMMLLYSVVFSIPLFGWMYLVYCACSARSVPRRSFARFWVILLLVAIVTAAIVVPSVMASMGKL